MGMMNVDTEWLYLISDTNNVDTDVTSELLNGMDGDNVAFVYNVSTSRPTECLVLQSDPSTY